MGYSCYLLTSFLILILVIINVANGEPLVPAIFIFGDSIVDVGNNNNRVIIAKANYPPYGRDFENHIPTGRFNNGKLSLDFIAETLGFPSYPPAYLNLRTKGDNLLNGANFASGASGYLDSTGLITNSVKLSEQLGYYKEFQNKLVEIAGESKASSIVSEAIYFICSGNMDFIQNYYANPLHSTIYSVAQFSDLIMQSYSTFIQNIYALGARRIGVTTLPPLGCVPAMITLLGFHSNGCVERLNNDARIFNSKLNETSQSLRQMLPHLNLVLLDLYRPLYQLVTNPTVYGFYEARRGCCGTGLIETVELCKLSLGTCANASEYVFCDSFHFTEAANKFVADKLIVSGISLLGKL